MPLWVFEHGGASKANGWEIESRRAMSEIDRLAEIIWNYHLLCHRLERADLILVLGSYDIRVAEHAAKLFLERWAPLILFSGTGYGHKDDLLSLSWRKWGRAEAEVFADRALEMGVPREKILIENRSKNVGENVEFSRALLAEKGINPSKIILVQKPYMERRAYATFKKKWPEPEVIVSSPSIPFPKYPTPDIPKDAVINLIVGDLQRIMEYPAQGYQIPQEVPEAVLAAYERLRELGFTKHAISH